MSKSLFAFPSQNWLSNIPNGLEKEQLSRYLDRAMGGHSDEDQDMRSLRNDLLEVLALLEKEQLAHAATKKKQEQALQEKLIFLFTKESWSHKNV